MTAIAYRDGILTADGVSWVGLDNQLKIIAPPKIVRLENGELAAGAGTTHECQLFTRYMQEKGKVFSILGMGEPTIEDDFEGIWIQKDLSIWICYKSLEFIPIRSNFFAIGYCSEFMMGAMYHGATAQQAVELACEHTNFAGLPIQIERIEQNA